MKSRLSDSAASRDVGIEPPVYLRMANVDPSEWSGVIDGHRRIIGRSFDAGIRIPDRFPFVSRRHAEIWREESKTVLCDVGSKTGTRVNNVWLKPKIPMAVVVGDHIWLGGVELSIAGQISPAAEMMLGSDGGLSTNFDHEESREMDTNMLPTRMLLETLTPAELDIAVWLCRGFFDDTELGQMLHRSPHTVRTQVGSVMRKLNLSSRHDIIGFLKKNGD